MSKRVEAEIERISAEMARLPCKDWDLLNTAKYTLVWANYKGWMPSPFEHIKELIRFTKKKGKAA